MKKFCCICKQKVNRERFLENGKDLEYQAPGMFSQIKCSQCGLVSMDPMPHLEKILSFYPHDYHGYQPPASRLTKFLIEHNLRARAQHYQRLIGNTGAILDVGAADGAHFDIWKKSGAWTLHGLEFKDKIAQNARAHGRDVATATIETYNPGGKKFKLIIMNHLLEHVIDPLETASRAYNLLEPRGVFIGETPNIRSLDFWIFRKYWGGCHWPRHLHQFDPKSMRAMLEKAGFVNIRFHYPLHTGHWALSIQNFLQSKKLTRSKLSYGRTRYYPLLLFLFAPINLIQKLFGITGIMGFTAQKPQ